MSDERQPRYVDVRVHGRYLVREPLTPSERPDVLVGFHGYGETAGRHLDELERLPGLEAWRLVAIEALHPFYKRTGEVVAAWMTRQDREMAIEENVAYTRAVIDRVVSEGDPGRLAVIGFSQGTAMAYRSAARCGRSIDAVVALGGDVPPDLAAVDPLPFHRVLIARGASETLYTPPALAADVETLRGREIEPDVLEFDGGHEWTDAFREKASAFLLSS